MAMVDPRQILAAFLTISMFAMLGNMIKRDHFDSIEVRIPASSTVKFDVVKVQQQGVDAPPKVVAMGPWKQNSPELKPCWNKPVSKEAEQSKDSKGFITFSLTSGPEYHISQVADAVAVARYLGAVLVLPDIRGSELGQKRNFQDMYDVDRFVKSLDGVVKIVREVPTQMAAEKPAVVRVPNRVTAYFIVKKIEPIFRTKNYIRLAVFFHSIDMKVKKQNKDLDSTACLTMFSALELKKEIHDVADKMIERLRTISHKSDGKFIAIDLRVDVLEKKGCKESGKAGRKTCYSPWEVRDFLKRLGFDGDTTIYLTQTWWHESLNQLKESFPKIYTKDDIIPSEKKGKFLKSGSAELERALDFHICSHSDVFVPAISGVFYANVAGKRIASGRTQILVPTQEFSSSSTTSDFISTYVSRKSHLAYTCYC